MAANDLEVEVSQMLLLVNELRSGKHVDPESDGWSGYHPKAYGERNLREKADQLAEKLCTALRKKTPNEIAAMSLEMQMWWREHKKADKEAGR